MDVFDRRKLYFLAWEVPDGPSGRVQLIPAGNFHDPVPYQGRTAEEITIPSGAVLSYVVEEEDSPFT